MYTKHGAFKVHFAGHDANSNILVACYQVVFMVLALLDKDLRTDKE